MLEPELNGEEIIIERNHTKSRGLKRGRECTSCSQCYQSLFKFGPFGKCDICNKLLCFNCNFYLPVCEICGRGFCQDCDSQIRECYTCYKHYCDLCPEHPCP
jgi:hypothetical protein